MRREDEHDRDDDDATSGGPDRSVGRRIVRAAVAVLLLGVGVLVALVLAIDFGWQRGRILDVAEGMAEARLGVPISLGRSSGRLWRGIELKDVVIGDPANPLVEVDALTIRWVPLSLLSQERWRATSILIEGWTARLHRDADGRWLVLEDVLDRLGDDGQSDAIAAGADTGPGLSVRRIELGEGTIALVVERPRLEDETEERDGDERPLRAIWRGEGALRRLDIAPGQPLEVAEARFEARLREVDSGVPDFDRDAEASLSVSIEGDRLDQLELTLSAPDLQATAQASGPFEDLDRIEIDVRSGDLQPLGGWFQTRHPLAGALQAHANLSGALSGLSGSLRIDGRALVVGTARARELALDVELERPFDVTRFDLEDLDARFDLRASDLDPGPLAAGRLPPGAANLDAAGEIAAGRLVLQRARLALAGLSLEGSGRADRRHIEHFDVAFRFEDVAPWVRVHRPDLQIAGPLAGEAKLAGEIPRLEGSVALRSTGLTLDGRSLGALDARLRRATDGPAKLDVSLVSDTETVLQGHAELDLERERVDFEATGRAGAWLDLLEDSPALEARLRLEGFVQRAEPIPRFALSLQSTETVVEDLDLGRFDIRLATGPGGDVEIEAITLAGPTGSIELLEPTTIELDARGRWRLPGATLAIAVPDGTPGHITLGGSGLAARLDRVEGSLDSLPLAIANRFRAELPRLSGVLDGELAWTRQRGEDWLRGDLEWTAPGIGDLELDQLTVAWRSTPDRIDIELATLVADRSPLSLDGEILVPDPTASLAEILSADRLVFEAVLNDWELSALEALTPRSIRSLAGRVSGSIRVAQDAGGPRLSGRATISQGGFTVPILRRRFEPIDGTFSLEGRRMSVDSLRVGNEGADAELVGSVTFPEKGEPAVEGTIVFDTLPLSRSAAAWGDVRGEVRLAGTLASPIVRGELTFENGRIGVPAGDDPIMKEIRIASRTRGGTLRESETPERTFRDGADLDVTIHVPPTTRVRGQGANLWVSGDLRILKPPLEGHRVLGVARVVNGTFRFQGRRFRVRRGRLQFTGTERLDPVLDIEAILPVSDIVAIIDVSGRLSSPIVRLLSEPALDERDVLAYLIFGRPADEIGAADDPAFGAAAARVAAGVAETELQEILGDAMPIDTIEVEADEMGNTSAVGVGKFLGPRIFLRYVHVLGDDPAERLGVEYRLNETFSVGSTVSSAGDAGIDLILRHDF